MACNNSRILQPRLQDLVYLPPLEEIGYQREVEIINHHIFLIFFHFILFHFSFLLFYMISFLHLISCNEIAKISYFEEEILT